MDRRNRWMLMVLIVAVLQLTACASSAGNAGEKVQPVKIEPVAETGFNRVILTEKAAERLDVQTAPVQEELVTHQRIVWGEVVALSDSNAADLNRVRVQVSFNQGDMNRFDRSKETLVLVLDDDNEDEELIAELDDNPDVESADVEGDDEVYYLVDNSDQKLIPGQRVRVVQDLLNSETQQLVIPYASVIYDLNGDTWVYVNPEPLVFVRHPVVIDYVDGDRAVLLEGPQAGVQVATVGVAELYGADTGVGK